MCKKECENYKPKGYPDCYKNKCVGCKCDGCQYARDCETRIVKCSYCPKIPTTYTSTVTYPYTHTPYYTATTPINYTMTIGTDGNTQ